MKIVEVSVIRKQKAFAMRLLKCLERLDGKPKYIMGGAPRNWRLGKLAVDYDVYLPSDVSITRINKLLNDEFAQDVDIHISLPHGHEYGEMIHSTFHAFINLTNMHDVNIILYDKNYTVEKILHDNFAFSICQAVMTSSGTTMYTNEFEETINTKIIRGMNGIKRGSNYAKKIESYFPEFIFQYE